MGFAAAQSVNANGKIGIMDQRVLNEIVQRIVKVANPEQITLFGSVARGEMGPNGDADLLVIKAGAHGRQLTQAVYMNLFGIEQAVNVIGVIPEDIEQYKDSLALVIEPALREGKVIYAR